MCLKLPIRVWRYILFGAAVLLTGCATLPQTAPEAELDEHPQTASSELPDVELSSELLYQLLLGEMAIQRGDYDIASEMLTQASEASRDYRVAERATRVSLRAKQYERAERTARIWSSLRPEDTVPLEIIAMALVKDGKVDEAQAVVTELFESVDDKPGNAYRRLADLLSRQPNHSGALELMTRLAEQYPDNPEIYFAQAYLADRLKQSELVQTAIGKALELRPNWEEAVLVKATHLVNSDATKDAVVEVCEQFLSANPKAKRVRLYLARYLVDQGDLSAALEEFSTLIELEPDNVDALYAAGLLGLQLERYEEAEAYLEKNLELRPNNDQARLYLGQLAMQRKRFDDAEEWYRSIRSEGYYFEAQLELSGALAETQGADAAMEHLKTLHPVDQDEYVRWVLAQEQVLRKSKRLMEAKEVLDIAVDRFPEDTELIYARGLLAAQLDLIEIHEQDMRKILVKDPNNAHALNALGYTLADTTDRYEEAHNLIEQALSIRPEDPFILDSMGWVQYRLGNHADAIAYLERALTKRHDAEIAAHLGEVLWVNGEQDRAKQVWQRALEEHPDNDVLRNTLKKFNQ